MRRVILLSVILITVLAGCAGRPQVTAPSTAQSDYSLSDRRHNSTSRVDPANRLAMQLRDFRRASPALIRQALLDEHQRWVGTPYVLGGEGRRGIDCSALVQQVFSQAFALDLPRTTHDQVLEGRHVDLDQLKAGDLVFFRPPGPYPHVGIYVEGGLFLHASASQGVILSRLDNAFWSRYYWQARRPLERTELAQRAQRSRAG